MTPFQLEIQITAVVVAVACALPGVFLVLRRMALMSDAISHSILLGIVLAFFVVQDLASPLLIIAATLTGVLTISLVELLNKTGLVREDAAIGLVFPALFSIGVILISRYAGDVHLDTDAVLRGELALVPFDRFSLFGFDLGPRAFALMLGILLLNILFITLFYKELKLATFDAALAAVLGFSPGLIHYGLMTIVSVTAVGAFDAVGSILVVALMVAPPAAAYLLTDRLGRMILLSAIIGAASAVSGYWLADVLDASIAGCMATMSGVAFGITFLIAPHRGIVAIARRRHRQRWEFARITLAIHLLNHESTPEAETENCFDTLHEHVYWDRTFIDKLVSQMERGKLVFIDNRQLVLTDSGRQLAGQAMMG
ncbi:MAG: metal ABC transporter permease [candidate division Zixibacteria bacterium]|nr:metal ABC transporter permease [candidate division Zixibacteria bacterium]MBU1470672.1 metal ABC transporter permease [candidate division Zixibacteria bacterium]MBU2626686.1 metal ABC transporter permease [candidate division Zixibacteria bacterium]